MTAGLASNGIARYKACRIGEMDILFVTATRIGDAVLSTGLISYLIDRYAGSATDHRSWAYRRAAV